MSLFKVMWGPDEEDAEYYEALSLLDLAYKLSKQPGDIDPDLVMLISESPVIRTQSTTIIIESNTDEVLDVIH